MSKDQCSEFSIRQWLRINRPKVSCDGGPCVSYRNVLSHLRSARAHWATSCQLSAPQITAKMAMMTNSFSRCRRPRRWRGSGNPLKFRLRRIKLPNCFDHPWPPGSVRLLHSITIGQFGSLRPPPIDFAIALHQVENIGCTNSSHFALRRAFCDTPAQDLPYQSVR